MVVWKFGQYVERLLNKKGWKASDLAKRAGLSHVYIGQLLRGSNPDTGKPPRLSVDTLQSIAKALGIPESKLLLAYRGIDPESDGDSPLSKFDLQQEISVFIMNHSHNLNEISDGERKQLEMSVMEISRKFIPVWIGYEIERLKKCSSGQDSR